MSDIPNHLLIVLKCFDTYNARRRVRRKRFENIWALDDRCPDVRRSAWDDSSGHEAEGYMTKSEK